jgi:transposase-like protein
MYFGSDDEKAITKSIQDAFPSATRRLCSKHLKDNFNHYMQDKIGIDAKERQHLMNVVFCQDGLTNADTTLMLEERSTKVTEEMKEYPALCQYYEKQMKPRIQSFVHEPRRNQKEFDQPLWTNNNSESVNHIFKRAVNWKLQTTPDLVEKFYDCVQIQFQDVYMVMVTMSYPMQTNTTLYLMKFGDARQKKKKKRSSLTS